MCNPKVFTLNEQLYAGNDLIAKEIETIHIFVIHSL